MPENVHDRWTKVLAAIRQECLDNGQSPDPLEADWSTLKVRLPLDASTYHSERFALAVLSDEDPSAIAARFYREYRAAVDSHE
jgi:hypothetical protein